MNWKQNSLEASRSLNLLEPDRIDAVLRAVADAAESQVDRILAANARDLERMERSNPMYDRLLLTPERIAGIAADMRQVADLPSPLGKVLMETERPNGMKIVKLTVPFGVIGIIYEARPNVSFDVFALCLKSGNACVLKGGSDAIHSNTAIVEVIREVLVAQGLDPHIVNLLAAGRDAAAELMNAVGYVDLIIPRGGKGLIDYVRDHSRIPVIETGAGICHTYFDASGDAEKGSSIIFNAKTRRVSVCNSLDCLVIHANRLTTLPQLCAPLAERNVIIYADEPSYAALTGHYPAQLLEVADAESFGTEFLDYKMAIKTVADSSEAIRHISQYSSKHSECIIAEDPAQIKIFERAVDAACVYSNVSTAFTDGAQFGLGAEIGISTQKMHARGPMALGELCSYKWVIRGDGQVRG